LNKERFETSLAPEQAFAEARSMLEYFTSACIMSFGVTLRDACGRSAGFKKIGAERLLGEFEQLLARAERNQYSVIIRPYFDVATTLYIGQLDGLDCAGAEDVAPFSLCVTETSPGRYQAFIFLADRNEEYADLCRHFNPSLRDNRRPSCAGYLAGSLNNEAIYQRPDGSYPRVRLAHLPATTNVVEVDELRAAGLLEELAQATPRLTNNRRVDSHPHSTRVSSVYNHARPLPSYAKALASVQRKEDGTPDRSAADLLFAVTCLRWRPPLSQREIAALLMVNSEKARGRRDAAMYVDATIDEAIRRA